VSIQLDGAWSRNPFRLVADVPRATPRVFLPDCPADCARVAVLIPPARIPEAYQLAGSKFGRRVGSVVRVRLFAALTDAEPADVSDPVGPTKARHVVVMPPRVTGETP
jgi:hypothetical protein